MRQSARKAGYNFRRSAFEVRGFQELDLGKAAQGPGESRGDEAEGFPLRDGTNRNTPPAPQPVARENRQISGCPPGVPPPDPFPSFDSTHKHVPVTGRTKRSGVAQ